MSDCLLVDQIVFPLAADVLDWALAEVGSSAGQATSQGSTSHITRTLVATTTLLCHSLLHHLAALSALAGFHEVYVQVLFLCLLACLCVSAIPTFFLTL